MAINYLGGGRTPPTLARRTGGGEIGPRRRKKPDPEARRANLARTGMTADVLKELIRQRKKLTPEGVASLRKSLGDTGGSSGGSSYTESRDPEERMRKRTSLMGEAEKQRIMRNARTDAVMARSRKNNMMERKRVSDRRKADADQLARAKAGDLSAYPGTITTDTGTKSAAALHGFGTEDEQDQLRQDIAQGRTESRRAGRAVATSGLQRAEAAQSNIRGAMPYRLDAQKHLAAQRDAGISGQDATSGPYGAPVTNQQAGEVERRRKLEADAYANAGGPAYQQMLQQNQPLMPTAARQEVDTSMRNFGYDQQALPAPNPYFPPPQPQPPAAPPMSLPTVPVPVPAAQGSMAGPPQMNMAPGPGYPGQVPGAGPQPMAPGQQPQGPFGTPGYPAQPQPGMQGNAGDQGQAGAPGQQQLPLNDALLQQAQYGQQNVNLANQMFGPQIGPQTGLGMAGTAQQHMAANTPLAAIPPDIPPAAPPVAPMTPRTQEQQERTAALWEARTRSLFRYGPDYAPGGAFGPTQAPPQAPGQAPGQGGGGMFEQGPPSAAEVARQKDYELRLRTQVHNEKTTKTAMDASIPKLSDIDKGRVVAAAGAVPSPISNDLLEEWKETATFGAYGGAKKIQAQKSAAFYAGVKKAVQIALQTDNPREALKELVSSWSDTDWYKLGYGDDASGIVNDAIGTLPPEKK